MWTLMIITTFWANGEGMYHNNYTFSPPVSYVVCQNLKKIVDDNEKNTAREYKPDTTVCVKLQ